MIYEAPEILAIADQKERLENAIKAIQSAIPEEYMDYRYHGISASKCYSTIMVEIFKARGLTPTDEMIKAASEF
jgi:hypothetical protein